MTEQGRSASWEMLVFAGYCSPPGTLHVSPFGLWAMSADTRVAESLGPSSCLDPGPHVAAAGARPDAGAGAPASSGGPGEASGGVRARGRGLLARRHDPAHERCRDQRGHRAAAESHRCLPRPGPGGLTASCGRGSLTRHRSQRRGARVQVLTLKLTVNIWNFPSSQPFATALPQGV